MSDADAMPVLTDATGWEEAQTILEAAGFGDGLPMAVPTRAALERMLVGVADRERSLGAMPPLFGEVTVAAVGYQSLLAGCRPAELPVVLAAAAACLDPAFNLLGLQTTTGTPAVAVIVHGEIAGSLAMNAGGNCLGPGNRANACIGRAMQFVLRNIGGARPGIGDMATMGQPGKYGFCFAESVETSPVLPSLAARRGLAAGAGAVTVLGVSGTMEVLPFGGATEPAAIIRPIAAAMRGARTASGGGRVRAGCEHVVLLPSEMLAVFERADWTLPRLLDALASEAGETVGAAPADIHPVLTGGAGVKMTYLPLWSGGTRAITRAVERP